MKFRHVIEKGEPYIRLEDIIEWLHTNNRAMQDASEEIMAEFGLTPKEAVIKYDAILADQLTGWRLAHKGA